MRTGGSAAEDCPAALDSGGDGAACSRQSGGGATWTMLPHLGQFRMAPIAEAFRTLSRTSQVGQVMEKSTGSKAGTCLTFKAGLKNGERLWARALTNCRALIALAARILRSRPRKNRKMRELLPSSQLQLGNLRPPAAAPPATISRVDLARAANRLAAQTAYRRTVFAAEKASAGQGVPLLGRSEHNEGFPGLMFWRAMPLSPEEPDGRLLDAAPRPENHLD